MTRVKMIMKVERCLSLKMITKFFVNDEVPIRDAVAG